MADSIHEVRASGEGRKDDQEKERWDLLPFGPVREVVKVLTVGARKYADWNWVKVPNARERYFGAAMRHLTAWWSGEKNDPETGLSHLAHGICCGLFLMWFDQQVAEEIKPDVMQMRDVTKPDVMQMRDVTISCDAAGFVKVTHLPTGYWARCGSRPTFTENKAEALRALREALWGDTSAR